MTGRGSAAVVHAPGVPEFELHTLGWRAFQDLCAAVLREVWGQSVQPFADSRDGGRDGAFYGTWMNGTATVDLPAGPFVLQCKFVASRNQTLTPSAVQDELAKVRALVSRGMCSSYVLMTNARVTGASEETIRAALRGEGVAHPLVLGGRWVNQTIASSQRLRMFVPRVYGLGDLSQILDERAYAQARALLGYLQEDLSTFVVTNAYRRAARAIETHGFCLLLGEPAVGKSVIAATLAMTALDRWNSLVVRADGPADVIGRWNPHEADQFFWVDDAFGALRHESDLTQEWVRRLPMVMAAVKGGARIVLTSRDYIYRAARHSLKPYAFPVLNEQQVVIDVAELAQHERRQIFYNHIRLGDQPAAVRAVLKPHLCDAADRAPFRPEVARRLGRNVYTKDMPITRDTVRDFVSRPSSFLRDVYEGLEADHVGAMAMVYQASQLQVPLERLTREQRDLLALVGSSYSSVARSLAELEGTFLRRAARPGCGDLQEYWSFRHPTLREGFADFLAANPNLLEVFIRGLDDKEILGQLDCGSRETQGTLITVPPSLYQLVASRVVSIGPEYRLTYFLATKCSREFVANCLELDSDLIDRSLGYLSDQGIILDSAIIASLYDFGVLPENRREETRDWIGKWAVEDPDADWINDPAVIRMLSKQEFEGIVSRVRTELIPNLDETLSYWRSNEQGNSAEEYYQPLDDALRKYAAALKEDHVAAGALAAALEQVHQQRSEARYWQPDDAEDEVEDESEPGQQDALLTKTNGGPSPTDGMASGRDVFDDVDQ
jgi:hypothetical protein